MGGSSLKKNMIAVCGVKNSGKTTLLVELIRELSKRGVKVAAVKHDGHDFSCDIPGTDSDCMAKAGAYGTAVFSDARIFVHKTGTGETELDLAAFFPEADLILLEGMKDSSYPKLEVIREGISMAPVSNPQGRFLIVTDRKNHVYGEPTLSFSETEQIAEKIMEQIGRTKKDEGNKDN